MQQFKILLCVVTLTFMRKNCTDIQLQILSLLPLTFFFKHSHEDMLYSTSSSILNNLVHLLITYFE